VRWLGRQAIGDGAGFVQACCNYGQAVAVEGLARDGIVAAAQLSFGNDLFGEIGARGDEDGQRLRDRARLRQPGRRQCKPRCRVRW